MAIGKKTKIWIRALIAAFISGAAGGVPTSIVATVIDPVAFNFGAELHKSLTLMAYAALIAGVIGASAYLKQSPIPPDDDEAPEPIASQPAKPLPPPPPAE